MQEKILELIENNSRLTPEQIAVMLGIKEEEVCAEIKKMEENQTIAGYMAIIDWEKTKKETVTALIEVKVTPQRGLGFDKIAERIYQYPEVKSVYLMSGGYDLCVIVEGKTMKDVALFVSQRLALLDSVISTATHFVLKKYKDHGIIFNGKSKDERAAIWL
ncbi:MAG: Lrp/AsnC family transcriptional regulator [Firmicutes bacterium]|nr:Lrp/AsnC family transcriptional regulator [Bacillota bacterium]